MIALCPNGKKIMFLTNNVDEIPTKVECSCEKETHNKNELIFNPSDEIMDEIRFNEDMED